MVSSNQSISHFLINHVRERRAPFNPATVKRLIQKDGVKVIVQPSNRRAYPMQVI